MKLGARLRTYVIYLRCNFYTIVLRFTYNTMVLCWSTWWFDLIFPDFVPLTPTRSSCCPTRPEALPTTVARIPHGRHHAAVDLWLDAQTWMPTRLRKKRTVIRKNLTDKIKDAVPLVSTRVPWESINKQSSTATTSMTCDADWTGLTCHHRHRPWHNR